MNLNKDNLEEQVEVTEEKGGLSKFIKGKTRAYALATLASLSPFKSYNAEAFGVEVRWSSSYNTSGGITNLDCEDFTNYDKYEIDKTNGKFAIRVKEFEEKCVFSGFLHFSQLMTKYLEEIEEGRNGDRIEMEKAMDNMKKFISKKSTRDLERIVNYLSLASWQYNELNDLYYYAEGILTDKKEGEGENESNERLNEYPDFDLNIVFAEYKNERGKGTKIINKTEEEEDGEYFYYKEGNTHYYKIPFYRKRDPVPFYFSVEIVGDRAIVRYEFDDRPHKKVLFTPEGTEETRIGNRSIHQPLSIDFEIDEEARYSKKRIKVKVEIDHWKK